MDNVELNDGVIVTSEVQEAIVRLRDSKACGLDNITAEHIKFASKKLCPLVAICCTDFFLVHGVIPDSMLSVVLVPVVKVKDGKLNSSDNYRPVALASVMSKELKTVLLCRLEKYVLSTDNQFGTDL